MYRHETNTVTRIAPGPNRTCATTVRTVPGSAIQSNFGHRDVHFVLLDREDDNGTVRLRPAASPAALESAIASLCTSSAARPTSPPSATDAESNERPPSVYAASTVLVADDNPVNQQVAVRMLGKFGCKAEIAADGMQAIAMHTWKRFDLILMDCDMPVLDGLGATRRIRADEGSGSRTPIIALTACTGQSELERCLAAGMDDFLSKPIRPQPLVEVLSRWLPRPYIGSGPEMGSGCEDELEQVKDMFGKDFAELAALYQHDGPPRLVAMHEAADAGDFTRVAKVAHAFGGSCASIGATGLSALCRILETDAKAGSLEDFAQRIAAIEAEYRRICGKLQSLLTR